MSGERRDDGAGVGIVIVGVPLAGTFFGGVKIVDAKIKPDNDEGDRKGRPYGGGHGRGVVRCVHPLPDHECVCHDVVFHPRNHILVGVPLAGTFFGVVKIVDAKIKPDNDEGDRKGRPYGGGHGRGVVRCVHPLPDHECVCHDVVFHPRNHILVGVPLAGTFFGVVKIVDAKIKPDNDEGDRKGRPYGGGHGRGVVRCVHPLPDHECVCHDVAFHPRNHILVGVPLAGTFFGVDHIESGTVSDTENISTS